MEKEILVSVEHDETKVAVLEDGSLVEYYIERPVTQRVVGNIYKGKVDNVLPGMQAAFVDIGLDRNSFLYVDDALMPKNEDDEEDIGEDLKNLTIKDILHVGQEIMVQVVKEPIGSKGARVSRHITLPGRYLVFMPSVDYVGVSRRIQEDKERDRLRKMTEGIRPSGVGLIVRTVAEGKSRKELESDMSFLKRLWNRVQQRSKNSKAPALLHRDIGLVYRIIRDLFTEDVERLYVDDRNERDRILDLLDYISPALKERVQLFSQKERSLFDFYGLGSEVEQALKKRVWLKSGGYLVIDQMEALTAIDVNTGKYVGTTNLADTVFKTNMEAAKEIARQLRLRDIGGIIIIDFIDMEKAEHRQEVLKVLDECLKRDRTKAHILGLTQLGLVEMTRKKVRQGLEASMLRPCPYCQGKGKVLSEETMARKVREELKSILKRSESEAVLIEVNPAVASLLIGAGGSNLRELEKETGRCVYIKGSDEVHMESINLRALGTRKEVEEKAFPVHEGQVLELKVEEPHVSNPWDGIARVEGYVIDIEGGGKMVGDRVKVEVTRAFRTYAKARLV
ncbi:MAG: Rne/Rng family ribonuclease [Bacillota bacterium]